LCLKAALVQLALADNPEMLRSEGERLVRLIEMV